ncbi:MAG: HAD-IA family hydrolase [Cyanobium sp.]
MPRPAACLFDLDGLLLDTEPSHAAAWSQAAAHFGLELTAAQLLQLRGRRRLDCAQQVAAWIEAVCRTPISSEELLAWRQPIAEKLLARAPAMPGAQALVHRCQHLAIPMALATSSSRAAVALKAAPHPWLATIRVRVHGDDPELLQGKPEPDVFLLAARRLGVKASECWAFEDSPAGAQAGLAAGCQVQVLRPEAIDPSLYPPGLQWLTSLEAVQLD